MYTVLVTSSCPFEPSAVNGGKALYCPAGVNKRLPSGVKVSRRKNDVRVSFAYIFVFLIPDPYIGFGDAGGITAGRGKDGAGEADRRMDGEEAPIDDRLLWEVWEGGFIGTARDCGVPGAEGAGEPVW